ncbi:efflux RND transporter permease subunit [Pseudoduganella umbonata]|uniref:Efflux RND transporter permease subunit n=1 Tax=Pseudoduganella umbonata TaxID=864828 RepID=A0A4P8HNE9_9BURK|nr:efflux RND transporter permease subunit [Pseudoduganella umbonata]MBB3219908.1 multidrug efflux pump subunit AcrB [Pseudoduganella umbonata]QCP09928.1 efflux RND transporter permease subunit [Pseudoduganella umbonata]
MNLSTWSLRNPIPVLLMFVLLSLAGLHGFRQLPIQNMPDLALPTVHIVLTQPGGTPAQLETEVARKVEDALVGVSGLKHVTTAITDSQVRIEAEFVLEKPLSDALIETKDAVDRVRADLPADLEQPAISADTTDSEPTLTYAVASGRIDEEALSWLIDDELTRALLQVPGVGRVARLGGVQREVLVELDPVKLAAHGVTAVDVSRALRRTQQDASGGRGQLGHGEQSMRTVATVRQAGELAALPMTMPDGRELRLDQVAMVSDSAADATSIALLDGRRVAGFEIYRARGSDETRVAAGVAKVVCRFAGDGRDLKFTPVSGTVRYTLQQYRGSMQMLYEGALLAVLVVWWFLRDWRATLVAASALPLSILPAFAAMHWLGYSLNTLTLLAMAVIVGILVDDAIVEIENIARHRRMGKPVMHATADAVNEIALAVIATTLTLVVVFIPTALMDGVPGLFFQQFGWTAVIAILASLLVARLLTPVLAARLLKFGPGAHDEPEAGDRPMESTGPMADYLVAVRWCLRHRAATVGAAVLFLAGSLALVPLIPTGLVPAADRGYITIGLELPPGSSLEATAAAAESVRGALAGVGGVTSLFASVGAAGDAASTARGANAATLTLTLAERDERPGQQEIEASIRPLLGHVAGAHFTVGGAMGEQLSLILASDDAHALQATAQAFERELRGVAGLANIRSTASLERPEIVVRPDAARAAERGVSTEEIGATVRVATMGDFEAQLAKLNLDNRQLAIRVRMNEALRTDFDALASLRVNGRGGQVPLASVASLSVDSGPAQIDRYDRRRQVTVSADLGAVPLGSAMNAALALPAARGMPSGVAVVDDGDAEIAAELAAGFGTAILTGLLCMYCVLALLFRDLLQPVTILSAIPLSLGGAFVALLLARSELDVPSMIGLVMLIGVVTKNSILLVEYAVVGMRDRALDVGDALLDACHKRARPIVMTTMAMVAGMLPIALGLGADASFRQPMAIAVIGGLTTSTFLSLFVVPVAFSYVDGLRRRLAVRFPGAGLAT